MKLAEYLCKECIQVKVQAKNKEEILHLLSKLVKKSTLANKLEEDEIYQGFLDRENLGSTGFGNRIAIPHFTTDKLNDFIVGAVTVPQGVDFKSIDKNKVFTFFFIIAPQTKRNQHLGILSNIARFLRSPNNIEALLAAVSPDALYDFVQKHKYSEEEILSNYEHNLIQVIVQQEDAFDEILNIFTEIDDCSISVLEANNAAKYLYSMPLFASFWNPEQRGYNRMILSVVRKSQTNLTLQKLNAVLEERKEKTGILILVQDLFYSNGLLEI